MQYMPDQDRFQRMNTAELRNHFLVDDLFEPGTVRIRFFDLDRVALGGVVPIDESLPLGTPEELGAAYFTERREVGVLNIGGPGSITVDGQVYDIPNRGGLYVGRGSREVTFASVRAAEPACFYLVSYPAHTSYPTAPFRKEEVQPVDLGVQKQANVRKLYKYVHLEGIRSAQLVMGITVLQEGSIWNTMPAHTHQRRTEVYLYFDVPDEAVVFHFMGSPQETRNLVVRNRQVVLSPAWSIHSGAGTQNYTFCWAMGGENQEFSDMQAAPITELK